LAKNADLFLHSPLVKSETAADRGPARAGNRAPPPRPAAATGENQESNPRKKTPDPFFALIEDMNRSIDEANAFIKDMGRS